MFKKLFLISFRLIFVSSCSAITLLCLVPPVSRDALVHHLAIPKIYLTAGTIVELPCMIWSYYPMNLDMLYMVALYFGSDIVPKLIHFTFGLLTAGVIYHYLHRRINQLYALAGVVFFFSIPIIIKLSISAYVDLGLVFFSTASLMAVLKWVETEFKLKYLLIAGAACGMAMGTKYNGLITFFLLSFIVPFLYSRCRKSPSKVGLKSVGWALVFVVSALLLFTPWMVRNYAWTKNPVYPLFNNIFSVQVENPCVTSGLIENHSENNIDIFTYRKLVYEETLWEMALLPVRIFFQGEDNNFKYFDGRLSVLLLFFPLLSFKSFTGKTEPYSYEKFYLFVFAFLFFIVAFFSSVLRIRYFAPSIPPLVILSIYGIKNVVDYSKTCSHSIMKKCLVYCLLFWGAFYMMVTVAVYFSEQFSRLKPFQYLSGQIRKTDYIGSFRHEHPSFQYINKHLDPGSKILFFYIGGRGYYCDKTYIPDQAGNHIKLLRNLITLSGNPAEIKDFLVRNSITHLLMNSIFFKQRIDADLDEREKGILFQFFNNYAEKEFEANHFSLYRIK